MLNILCIGRPYFSLIILTKITSSIQKNLYMFDTIYHLIRFIGTNFLNSGQFLKFIHLSRSTPKYLNQKRGIEIYCIIIVSLQICSQLSERLEKQQTANKEELQRLKVKNILTPPFLQPLSTLRAMSNDRYISDIDL